MRVLAIDVGVWTFTHCICDGNHVTEWETVSLLDVAGFPGARGRVSFKELTQSMLIDIAHRALNRMFPALRVCHEFDLVAIESQPRKRSGKATKMVEVGMAIYRYFYEIVAPHRRQCGCWRFPRVMLMGAASKFDRGDFFGVAGEGIPKGTEYAARKKYAERFAAALLAEEGRLVCSDALRQTFAGAKKADDMADALLLAAIGLRDG